MWMTALYVIVGTLCITKVEMLSREIDSFSEYLMYGAPFILLGQYCLFNIYSQASSIMAAWLSWTIVMALLRVANSHFLLNEGLDLRWTIASVVLMFSASLAMKQA
tara:strand:+ start:143 stop:460 length:318 start_codon:yes stop_codon:yes gene_type:complete